MEVSSCQYTGKRLVKWMITSGQMMTFLWSWKNIKWCPFWQTFTCHWRCVLLLLIKDLKKQMIWPQKLSRHALRSSSIFMTTLRLITNLQWGKMKRTSFSLMSFQLIIRMSLFSDKNNITKWQWMLSDLSFNCPFANNANKRVLKNRIQGDWLRDGDHWQKCVAAWCKNTSTTKSDPRYKQPHKENLCCFCKTDGYDIVRKSCAHHNWDNLDYCQPDDCSNDHSLDWAPQEHNFCLK